MPTCGGRDGSFSVACCRDHIDYVENQCSKPLPDCSYTVGSRDVTVIANDDILYSRTVQDCQRFCDDVSGTIIILYFPFLLKKIRSYTVKLTHSHNIVWTISTECKLLSCFMQARAFNCRSFAQKGDRCYLRYSHWIINEIV